MLKLSFRVTLKKRKNVSDIVLESIPKERVPTFVNNRRREYIMQQARLLLK
jgi:hypothetical protein